MELLKPNGDPVKAGELEEDREYTIEYENGKVYIIDLIQIPASSMSRKQANRNFNKQMSDLVQDAVDKVGTK